MNGIHRLCVLAVLLTAAPLAVQETNAPMGLAPEQDRAAAVPGSHRHFLIPTGRTLPAGAMEAGAYQLAAPYIGYALHDRVMLAVGTPALPDAFARYWYVLPKLGLLRGPRWNAAVGGLILADLGSSAFAGGDPLNARSAAWGVVTWGGSAGAVTLGAASDMGGPFGMPRDWLILSSAELRVLRDDRGVEPDVIRLIYKCHLAARPERALEGMHLVGVRWRGGPRGRGGDDADHCETTRENRGGRRTATRRSSGEARRPQRPACVGPRAGPSASCVPSSICRQGNGQPQCAAPAPEAASRCRRISVGLLPSRRRKARLDATSGGASELPARGWNAAGNAVRQPRHQRPAISMWAARHAAIST